MEDGEVREVRVVPVEAAAGAPAPVVALSYPQDQKLVVKAVPPAKAVAAVPVVMGGKER